MQFVKELDSLRESQPYYIYKRIELNTPTARFLHTIDYGFWYLLRKIHFKYPSVDVTGAIFGPNLRFETYQTAANKFPQNVPIPFELVGSPGSTGVTIDAAGNMTATPVLNAKLQNVVHPYRDTIDFRITGQNLTTPTQIDIMLIGYYIPEKKLQMWSGQNAGEN